MSESDAQLLSRLSLGGPPVRLGRYALAAHRPERGRTGPVAVTTVAAIPDPLMKPFLLSVALASVSPLALAQHSPDPVSKDAGTASLEDRMACESVEAGLPQAIETSVLDDWFETEFDEEVHPSVIKAARRAYTQTMFEPVWTEQGAAALQTAARDLFDLGLAKGEVLDSNLQAIVDQRFSSDSDEARAEGDLRLSAAWLRIASAVSGGLADEGEAAESERAAATYALIPEKLIEAGKSDGSLGFEAFETDYPQYERLKDLLDEYRGIRDAGGWLAVPDGDTIEPGDTDPRVPALRDRLEAENFIEAADTTDKVTGSLQARPASFETGDDKPEGDTEETSVKDGDDEKGTKKTETYTEELVEGVKAFQRHHGIKVDGLVGPSTLEALNESVESKIARIAGSLDRWRQQGMADDEYVWVNIPSYRAEGWRDGERKIGMKAIVGTPANPTPTFNDQIEYVVANPKWYMPVSILRNEKVPRLQEDPGYAKRANFSVVDRSTGEAVSAYSVDWTDPGVASEYRLVQQPGENNALGDLKIIFPNQYSVYLHGTPGKHLFDRAKRAFSHGCVRLEQPIEMAEWLAGSDRKVEPETVERTVEAEEHERFDFKRRVPVHITYMTVTVDESGQAHFWRDIYDRAEGIRQVEKYASSEEAAGHDQEKRG